MVAATVPEITNTDECPQRYLIYRYCVKTCSNSKQFKEIILAQGDAPGDVSDEMERVVPCVELEALIRATIPTALTVDPPVGLSVMRGIHFLQQWFKLSNPGLRRRAVRIRGAVPVCAWT